jgi:hypothetical protein
MGITLETGLINPFWLVMPRMRPAIEAGLMLPAEATALFMRPVLETPLRDRWPIEERPRRRSCNLRNSGGYECRLARYDVRKSRWPESLARCKAIHLDGSVGEHIWRFALTESAQISLQI